MAHCYAMIEELRRRAHSLIIHIDRVAKPLVNERLVKLRSPDMWHTFVKEVWTPKGLPLTFSLSLGETNEFAVYSAEALMLSVWPPDLSFEVDVRLPTDEMMRVTIRPFQG